MIKLVLTDMDGTFLNSQGNFNRELYQIVKTKMKEAGVIFAPVTGKQCERVEELFGEDAANLWILGDSATRIKHNGQFVYESLLPNTLGLEIIHRLEEISLEQTIIACTQSGAVIKKNVPASEAEIVRRSYAKVIQVESFDEVTEDFIKITVHDPLARCVETKKQLASFFEQTYIVASEPTWIDISNEGVHKGTTVARLQQLLNVSKDETMVFGDGYNDLELMACGTYSFAVRNPVQEVKDAATFITRSNDEDGVLNTILHMLAR